MATKVSKYDFLNKQFLSEDQFLSELDKVISNLPCNPDKFIKRFSQIFDFMKVFNYLDTTYSDSPEIIIKIFAKYIGKRFTVKVHGFSSNESYEVSMIDNREIKYLFNSILNDDETIKKLLPLIIETLIPKLESVDFLFRRQFQTMLMQNDYYPMSDIMNISRMNKLFYIVREEKNTLVLDFAPYFQFLKNNQVFIGTFNTRWIPTISMFLNSVSDTVSSTDKDIDVVINYKDGVTSSDNTRICLQELSFNSHKVSVKDQLIYSLIVNTLHYINKSFDSLGFFYSYLKENNYQFYMDMREFYYICDKWNTTSFKENKADKNSLTNLLFLDNYESNRSYSLMPYLTENGQYYLNNFNEIDYHPSFSMIDVKVSDKKYLSEIDSLESLVSNLRPGVKLSFSLVYDYFDTHINTSKAPNEYKCTEFVKDLTHLPYYILEELSNSYTIVSVIKRAYTHFPTENYTKALIKLFTNVPEFFLKITNDYYDIETMRFITLLVANVPVEQLDMMLVEAYRSGRNQGRLNKDYFSVLKKLLKSFSNFLKYSSTEVNINDLKIYTKSIENMLAVQSGRSITTNKGSLDKYLKELNDIEHKALTIMALNALDMINSYSMDAYSSYISPVSSIDSELMNSAIEYMTKDKAYLIFMNNSKEILEKQKFQDIYKASAGNIPCNTSLMPLYTVRNYIAWNMEIPEAIEVFGKALCNQKDNIIYIITTLEKFAKDYYLEKFAVTEVPEDIRCFLREYYLELIKENTQKSMQQLVDIAVNNCIE